MSLSGASGSGFCTLSAWGALAGGRSGRALRDSRKGNVVLAAEDSLGIVFGGNRKSGSCNYGENWVRRFVRNDACHFSEAKGWSWLVGNNFYPLAQKKDYKFLSRSVRRVAKGDSWRSEFREATHSRNLKVLKSVSAPADFTSNPSKGSGCGQARDGPTGEMGDLGAAMVPADDAVSGIRGECDVRVIGVGARACSILSFCQQTSLLPSAQFWTYGADSALQNARLTDHLEASTSFASASANERNQDVPGIPGNNSRTVFLVLGAGTGTGLGSAPRQLNAARMKGWLAVGIFIQPFTFEGQKRLEQANQLIEDLLECTDVVLVVEQDALLKGEAVTVSDATDMANNTVLLSIAAITELQAGTAGGIVDPVHASEISEHRSKWLQKTGKSWLGSGKGQNVREAVETSLVDSPAFDSPLVEGKVSVLCTLASANGGAREDLSEAGSILRRALGSEIHLVSYAVINPLLEPGVTLATVIITRLGKEIKARDGKYPRNVGSTGNDTPFNLQSSGISVSTNVQSSYSVSPLRGSVQEGASPTVAKSSFSGRGSESSPLSRQETLREPPNRENNADGFSHSNKENRKQLSRVPVKKATVRSFRTASIEDRRKVDARPGSPQASLAGSASKRSWVTLGWESGPSSAVAEAWAQARADARRPARVVSGSDVILPVGVRLRTDKPQVGSSENFDSSVEVDALDRRESPGPVPVDPDAVPRNRIVDMGLGAVMDMYSAASALVMGKETVDERKQPSLTQRASSMLESERSQKKLTPMVEMEFKNGIYKGRCLAGLPDGKGRLTFSDGSFYDGQWKQGKRAGAGTFYYANGDLFQGSWKDDVMHGKGWMYYHNGDRLYANFWKGKAHGEGRFYSAQGDVFFGQFRDNWRHGECLHIEASGVRWTEIWENGVFIFRTPDDS